MKINICDLEKVSNLLFARLKEIGIESVELKEDAYWNVSEEKKYNVSEEPDLNIGSLGDDWSLLLSDVKIGSASSAYMLIHLAPLLDYIGQEAAIEGEKRFFSE